MKQYDLSKENGLEHEMSMMETRFGGPNHKKHNLYNVDMKNNADGAKQKESFFERNKNTISTVRTVILLLLFLAYYGYAMYCNFGDEGSIRLSVFTAFGLSYIGWNKVKKYEKFRKRQKSVITAIYRTYTHGRRPKIIRWFLYLTWTGLLVAYLVINVALQDPGKLRSLGGYVVFILILVLISNNKRLINWHCVFWGSAVQCLLGYFVIKSEAGQTIIEWFSDRLGEFMGYSRAGSEFAFGKNYMDHRFAMQAMPSVLVFCAVIQVLVYLGTIQFIVRTLGKVVAAILDVSAPEATNACANIFLGGIEAALMVIEYIDGMPTSRLFTLMTNWFSSCGGTALIQFITFGVPASYLLAASAMSAPAALVCAKLAYPDVDQRDFNNGPNDIALEVVTNRVDLDEIDESKTEQNNEHPTGDHGDDVKQISKRKGHSKDAEEVNDGKKENAKRRSNKPNNIGEAVVVGTRQGLKLVTNIIGNIIVSLSMLELLDKTVEWFGNRVNINISLKILFSYVFFPFVYIMGVDQADCLRAGEMLGVRAISNAGISYRELGRLIENRAILEDYTSGLNGTFNYERDSDIFLPHLNRTLEGGVFSARSEVIVSYALCGFASVPMIGMAIGALSVLIPDRAPEITTLAFKTLITGTIASYLTACVAGLVA